MRVEEKEDLWDDLLQKEEGIILGFDPETTLGKVKSLTTGEIYPIDPRERVRTRIELKNGDFFASCCQCVRTCPELHLFRKQGLS